jgi:O-antigen/teichoic acid export membrane protein
MYPGHVGMLCRERTDTSDEVRPQPVVRPEQHHQIGAGLVDTALEVAIDTEASRIRQVADALVVEFTQPRLERAVLTGGRVVDDGEPPRGIGLGEDTLYGLTKEPTVAVSGHHDIDGVREVNGVRHPQRVSAWDALISTGRCVGRRPPYCRGMPQSSELRRRAGGVAPVGAGLLLLGASSYVVLGIAGHALEAAEYTAFASLYLVIAIAGPGMFAAVEQETNRDLSARTAAGAGTRPVLTGGAVVAAGLAVAVGGLLLVFAPVLVPAVLGGYWELLAAAVVAVFGSAAIYLQRGLFAGQRRYGWYAMTLAAEGLGRILPVLALAAAGAAGAGAFGLAFALGTGVAALLCWPGVRPGAPGPPVDLRSAFAGAGMLAAASGLTYLVANLAPLVLTARLPEAPAIAASFVSLFVLARAPIFLFAPLQAFLLPSLTAGVERGDVVHVRSRLRVVALAVGIVGASGVALAWTFGPWAARVFFDAPVDLPHVAAGLLGLSTAAMMAAQALQPALVALGQHRVAMAAWLAGALVFVAVLFVPGDAVTSAVAAQVAGPTTVVIVMSLAVHAGVRRLAAASTLTVP